MKDKLKDIMNSEKGPTKIKLFLYIFFLGFVVLFLILSGSFTSTTSNNGEFIQSQETQEKDNVSFWEKQDKLINGSYSYKFIIDVDNTIIFDGKVSDGINIGYKETINGIIKYKIVNDKVYRVTGSKEEEYDKLYQDVNQKLLSLNYIFELINSSAAIIDRQEEYTVYNYNIDETTYKVYTDDTSIYRIEITFNEQTYNYEFTY